MAENESSDAPVRVTTRSSSGPGGRRPGLVERSRARWGQLDTKARTAVVLVVGAVLVVGIGTVIGKVAEFDEVLRAIREASPAWLAVCLLGEVIAYVGYILAFWGTRRARPADSTRSDDAWRVRRLRRLRSRERGRWPRDRLLDVARSRAGTRSAVRRVLALNTLLYAVFGVGAFVVAILVVTNVSDVPLGMAIPWLVIVPPASSSECG